MKLFALVFLVIVLIVTIAKIFNVLNEIPDGPSDEVPNLVHFIRFGNKKVTFIEAVCMLAALKNQRPNKIYVHTDTNPGKIHWGKYWDAVVGSPEAEGVIKVKYLPLLSSIMGREINFNYLYQHAADFERIRILIKYGGIYLDNDSYIVKNLSEFFKYEMTLGWNGVEVFNQVLIAKRSSRFLRLWRESYFDFRPDSWYYNGGHLPGKLVKMVPEWVHTLPHFLAEYGPYVARMLYYWDTGVWKQHYAIHLLEHHQYMLRKDMLTLANVTYPVEFDENNILKYPINIRQMALDVYPYNQTVMRKFAEIYPHLPRTEDVPIKNEYESETESNSQLNYINNLIEMIKKGEKGS